jgi:hypothetical protein
MGGRDGKQHERQQDDARPEARPLTINPKVLTSSSLQQFITTMSDARSGLMARPPVAERCLAGNTVWWYEHTGDKIVYWGGSAHL